MDRRPHWEQIYATKAFDRVSWFRPHLETSLGLIEQATQGDRAAAIIDVGGGASTLVDDLIGRGYRNVTVLDISQAALDDSRERLGEVGAAVRWMCADVLAAQLPEHYFDIWHDRAVFHFLTLPEDRIAYVRRASCALKPGGHIVMSTFGPEGPLKCSGLDVVRYDAPVLGRELGNAFGLTESLMEVHRTPFGTDQQFLYCCFKVI
jgi:SAM-dependent methyltransferase